MIISLPKGPLTHMYIKYFLSVFSGNFLLSMEPEMSEGHVTTVETVITTNEDIPSAHETEIDSDVIDAESFPPQVRLYHIVTATVFPLEF